MAVSKKNEFAEDEIALAEMARALAHPARIAILKTLAERNECICGEIVEVLPLAQATVSQHLKELKAIGLIHGEVEGVRSCYCINWEKFEAFKNLSDEFFKSIKKQKPKEKCC